MSEPVELFPLAYGDHRIMMMARRTLTAQYSRKMNVVRDGFIIWIFLPVVGFHRLSRERRMYSSPSPRKGQLTYDGVGHWFPKEPG